MLIQGDIWTGNPENPWSNAIFVENGKIRALGEEALALAAHSPIPTLPLGDEVLVPAFGEGHAHPLYGGREFQGPQITGLKSVSAIVAEVKRFAQAHPDDEWIVGSSYEAAIIEGGNFLASWLDEAVSDRPVFLRAMDFHTVWVNTKALQLAGITNQTPNPQGGSIARDILGNPEGTLREPSAIALVEKIIPLRTIEDDVAALEFALNRYRDHGVTYVQDAWVDQEILAVYEKAYAQGKCAVDVNLAFLVSPTDWQEIAPWAISARERLEKIAVTKTSHEKILTARTIKFLCDGALSAGTALLIDNYEDSENRGIKIWSDENLQAAVTYFDSLGFQVHIHAIGDGAIRQALDAIENMQKTNPPRDRRSVIAHAQLINENDLPRFAELGVIANIQPLWCYLDPMNKELILPRIGEQRNNSQYQLNSLLSAGVRISFGSDWPVTSEDPRLALGVPVTRVSPHEIGNSQAQPWSDEEAITIDQSLTAYTKNVAYQLFAEDRFGTLSVGAPAKFTSIPRSFFALKN